MLLFGPLSWCVCKWPQLAPHKWASDPSRQMREGALHFGAQSPLASLLWRFCQVLGPCSYPLSPQLRRQYMSWHCPHFLFSMIQLNFVCIHELEMSIYFRVWKISAQPGFLICLKLLGYVFRVLFTYKCVAPGHPCHLMHKCCVLRIERTSFEII